MTAVHIWTAVCACHTFIKVQKMLLWAVRKAEVSNEKTIGLFAGL